MHIVTPVQQLGLNGRGEKPKFESNSSISDNFFVGSHIRVYRLSLSAKGWVDSYLSLYFRTIALLVIFSQYLSRFDVPLPAFSRDRGCHVIRYPLFRSFPVSMIQCLGYLFRLKENRVRVHRNSPSQFTNNSDFKRKILAWQKRIKGYKWSSIYELCILFLASHQSFPLESERNYLLCFFYRLSWP